MTGFNVQAQKVGSKKLDTFETRWQSCRTPRFGWLRHGYVQGVRLFAHYANTEGAKKILLSPQTYADPVSGSRHWTITL